MLELFIDFKCPASYLAVQPTLSFIGKTGTRICWRPFNGTQSPVPAEKPDETRGDTHRRVRALQQRETHQRYAETQGLQMQMRDIAGDTSAALAVLLVKSGDMTEFIQSAFNAYWTTNADLTNPVTVLKLARDSGLNLTEEAFASATKAMPDHQFQAEENGIFTTPTYRIDGQLFVGREHLPWISKPDRQ